MNKVTSSCPLSIVVLISGNGSNLQAMIDAIGEGALNAEIRAVISDKENAYGLVRAKSHGVATEILTKDKFSDREQYDLALQQCIENYHADLIVLSGFMRILTTKFVQHFKGRIINIHPALLPKYRGLHTHQRVLESGDKIHGTTVHVVTPELDSGPILAQQTVEVLANDTENTLQARVQAAEHQLYPAVLQRIANGEITLPFTMD